jgi:hypothetical protein
MKIALGSLFGSATMSMQDSKSSAGSECSCESSVTFLRDCVFPWSSATSEGVLTCSPVRDGRIICIDTTCDQHDKDGKAIDTGDNSMHGGSWKATFLERVIVFSFKDIQPRNAVGMMQFEGWTETELKEACLNTNCSSFTNNSFFVNKVGARKLQKYVAGFANVSDIISSDIYGEKIDGPAACWNCIANMSGDVDPVLFVAVMKVKFDSMSEKIVRLQNTVSIWKDEAIKNKKETEMLKSKIRYLKK